MDSKSVRLVAFDLDGTIIRGDTTCELLARPLGRLERMRELERRRGIEPERRARVEMATWYRGTPLADLCSALAAASLAPGVREAFALLRRHRVKTAIVSVTWDFAVEWFARQFGADYFVGTNLLPDGQIDHFWPDDKARWVADLALQLGVPLDEVAAVGDSAGDVPMLRLVGRPYYIGTLKPAELGGVPHLSGADLSCIARELVQGH